MEKSKVEFTLSLDENTAKQVQEAGNFFGQKESAKTLKILLNLLEENSSFKEWKKSQKEKEEIEEIDKEFVNTCSKSIHSVQSTQNNCNVNTIKDSKQKESQNVTLEGKNEVVEVVQGFDHKIQETSQKEDDIIVIEVSDDENEDKKERRSEVEYEIEKKNLNEIIEENKVEEWNKQRKKEDKIDEKEKEGQKKDSDSKDTKKRKESTISVPLFNKKLNEKTNQHFIEIDEEDEKEKVILDQNELTEAIIQNFILTSYVSTGNPKEGLSLQEIYSTGDLSLLKDHKKGHVLSKIRRYIVEIEPKIFEKYQNGINRFVLLKDPNELLEEIKNNTKESLNQEESKEEPETMLKEIMIQPKIKSEAIPKVKFLGWKIDFKTNQTKTFKKFCFLCKSKLASKNHVNCCKSNCKKIFHKKCISNFQDDQKYFCGSHSCIVCQSQKEIEWSCEFCLNAFCVNHYTKGYICECSITK